MKGSHEAQEKTMFHRNIANINKTIVIVEIKKSQMTKPAVHE